MGAWSLEAFFHLVIQKSRSPRPLWLCHLLDLSVICLQLQKEKESTEKSHEMLDLPGTEGSHII